MVRYRGSQFTKRELEIMVEGLATAAGIDFLTGGALNKYSRSAAVKVTKAVGSLAFRGAAAVVPSVAGSVGRAALPLVTNPYLAGTALGLGALQTQPGQQLLESAAQSGADTRRSLDMALFNIQAQAEEKVKKTKSKFNRAVGAGMKAAKASASYGKKGVITAPKKAFKAVTKLASKINRAKKENLKLPSRPKSNNPKKIYNAILKVLK
jgi:hypothetical protein